MAGGTGSHPTITRRALVGKCNRNSKIKIPGEGKIKNNPHPYAVVCLTTPISSYTVKGYPFEVNLPANLRITGTILADAVRSID